MKVDGHGQAKILTTEEIQLLFTEGLTSSRDHACYRRIKDFTSGLLPHP